MTHPADKEERTEDLIEQLLAEESDETAHFAPGKSTTIVELLPEKIIADLLKREQGSEKYVVDGKIGQGGMGAIYRVFDQDLKRATVLKVILPGVMEDALLFSRFIEEAQITGQLEHPNIVPVHELGVLGDDKLYFAMKFVEGQALGEILKGVRDSAPGFREKYTRFTLLTIFRKVCDAIGYAHSREIIHRDIKPDNIMVGPYGEVLLMDWGLARPSDRHDEADDTGEPTCSSDDALKTKYGVVKGTPAYMSPEQAKGLVAEIDKRSDIYLLGTTLYAMVTFCVPFTGNDIYEILANAENGNYVPPGMRAPEHEIPEELCRIIQKAMGYLPEDRYQTVEELSADIDALMAGDIGSVRKEFAKGEFVIEEGDAGYEAYVILSGKVEVLTTVRGKPITLISLGPGDVIGEMALILQAPRTASVVATEDTEVIVITEDTMHQGLGQLPPWMGKVVDSLADRVRNANANVHPLMSGDCTYHVMNQIRLIYAYWGKPIIDESTNAAITILDTNAAVYEIATNLCITKEKVALVVSHLIDSNLLQSYTGAEFFIPNIDLFSQFIQFAMEQIRIESSFDNSMKKSLFVNGDELVVRHSVTKGDAKSTGGEPTAVVPYPAKDLIGCETEEEKLAHFDAILNQLKYLFEPKAPEEEENV